MFFLASGLFTLWFCNKVLGIRTEGVIASIVFVPLISYLLFSGVLKSFKYGSLEATLSDSVSDVIDFKNDEKIESSVEDSMIIEKLGIDELKRRLPGLDNSQFIILTLTIGKGEYYTPQALKIYLETLSSFSSFKFVVFIDVNKKFVAYLPVNKVIKLLNNVSLGNEFVSFINQGDLYKLNLFSLNIETVNTETRIIDSLKEMFNKNLDSLVVIDSARNVAGIVERDYLVGKLLLSTVTR